MTTVSIHGPAFHIDGRPTHAGRTFEGHSIEGLLFNVRVVQATFDDANPETRRLWAYPDTGAWDPDRNTEEFCAALPAWRDHGVLGFTLNVQGGGPLFAPEIYARFDNNGYTPSGDLRPAYAERLGRVLDRADALGMVPILGLFYVAHLGRLEGEAAVRRAGLAALDWLAATGHRNVLVEVANEADICAQRAGLGMFLPEGVHALVDAYRAAHPEFLYSCSLRGVRPETGAGMPSDALIAACDYVLLHGNGARAERLEAAIRAVRERPAFRARPMPIVINEDSPGLPNLEAAWQNSASWGYFDQGYGGEAAWAGDAYVDYRARPREARYEDLSGFQTPPVNWTINTDHKRGFFQRVAEITGYPPAKGNDR